MEAPEKIYIPTILVANTVRYKEEGSIEYIRADAFIEKAAEWLKELGSDDLVEEFKSYMEGE